jgi:hypothetical protein
MAIIKILVKTVIRVVCYIFAVFGVISEGLTKIFSKLTDYLNMLDTKVDNVGTKKKKDKKKR